MKRSIRIFIIASTILILGCEDDKIISDPNYLFVFCDLSTSLNEKDIESQGDKIKRIINGLTYNTYINIYPMDLSIYQDPIIGDSIIQKSVFASINAETDRKRKKLADSIPRLLINKYNSRNKNEITEFKSCIISSLEMAYNLLPKDSLALTNTQVIFMTDMIEQCPESITGSMYMCSKTKQPDFDAIEKQIETEYNPDFKLSEKLNADQIHFVITSSYGNQKKCMNENQQQKIWDKILTKQGYKNPRKIHRSTALPEKLW